MELKLDAKRDKLYEVLDFVEGELKAHNCLPKTQMMIAVMVEEIYINIASYAYDQVGGEGDAIIGLEWLDDDTIYMYFIDSGREFDPLAKEDPDITLSAEERGIGGLGIYMVKQTMEDVKYERKDGKNILSFKKNIRV